MAKLENCKISFPKYSRFNLTIFYVTLLLYNWHLPAIVIAGLNELVCFSVIAKVSILCIPENFAACFISNVSHLCINGSHTARTNRCIEKRLIILFYGIDKIL